MTDRESLLAAIQANPRDDLPRLVYADWLDEFGTTDLDAATSEFIRVSVAFKGKQRRPVGVNGMMAPAGYEWLHDNWHRLVPSLTKDSSVRDFTRQGRTVFCNVIGRRIGDWTTTYQIKVCLDFSNGWLRRAWWWHHVSNFGEAVYQLIASDQPQAEMASVGAPAWEEQERRRAEYSARRERMSQDRASELVAGLESLRTILADRGVQGI